MGGHAWVTLATNDSYSLGALVLAHSLKQVGTQQQLAVLITPGVTEPMRSKLSEVFNVVVEVNLLDSKDETNLRLLKRPELGVTFTKLHCWRLTQFDKCVFLDADTLVLENCDELFDRDELSAAPDIGWPDCFNSGVFVFRPSMETYEKLIQFALEKGSFDGGDQGLLNLYFSDWAHKDISKHLPFIYNMASTACYSYLPAFKQFGKSAKIIHFIGASKPWLQYFDTETRLVHPAEGLKHMQEIFQLWWNIFCNFIHPGLSPQMTSHTDTVHGSQSSTYQNPSYTLQSPDTSYPAEDYQKVWDPWEEYDSRQQSSYSQNQNIHETSSPYGYQIPETNISDHQNTQYQSTEHHHYHSQPAEHHNVQNHPNVQHNIQSNQNEHHNIQTHSAEHHNIQSDSAGDHNIQNHFSEHHNIQSQPAEYHNIQSRPTEHHNFQNHSAEYNNIQSHSAEHHNIESNQYFQQNNSEYNAAQSHGIQHQDEHIESHNTSACIEAHNHDHPNPVHSQLQTPVTIPIQQHLFSSNQPPPPNDPPIPNLPDECMATTTVSNEMTLQNDSKEDSNENNAGIAGAFAKLTLGSPRTAEQLALDDHLRRQGWEVGNIDYMGRDSFQNIWNKICETLSSPPEQPTTIKETSPPTAESKPVEDLPLEVKSDERSVEVASSEVQPIKDVIEAEPAEKPTTGIPQECQVSQTTVTPAAETSQSLSSDEIAVSEKIVEAEISKTADKGESKTEAQATEPSVDKAQKSEAAPVQSQIATPTSVAQTQDVVTPEVGSQPVTETPTTKAPETPATSVPEISPAQAQETPVTAVTESATAKAPAATVPEPSPTKATETSVVTVPEASLAKAPVATVPEASPAKAPVVTVPEASLEKVPETPVKSVDEPTKVPESPIISPAESSKPFPVQPPPSPADPQLVTPVISAGDSSKAQPTLEQQPAKDSPTSVLEKSAAGDSTTPVAKATQPEPKQDSFTKKPIGKLNVAVAKASGAPAPKPQAEVTAPSPPTTPLSPQPQQVRVAKEASKVESTVPTTPPLDTQQTSSGPTPPPRKSSGGTKKATKPKK